MWIGIMLRISITERALAEELPLFWTTGTPHVQVTRQGIPLQYRDWIQGNDHCEPGNHVCLLVDEWVHYLTTSAILIESNMGEIFLSDNQQISQKMKHIFFCEYFTRNLVSEGFLCLKHVTSFQNYGYTMTKNVPVNIHDPFSIKFMPEWFWCPQVKIGRMSKRVVLRVSLEQWKIHEQTKFQGPIKKRHLRLMKELLCPKILDSSTREWQEPVIGTSWQVSGWIFGCWICKSNGTGSHCSRTTTHWICEHSSCNVSLWRN